MKTMTLPDLLEALKGWDEVYLIETLELRSEDIVERFKDIIEENFDFLVSEVEDMPSIYDDEEDAQDDEGLTEIPEDDD